MITKLDIDDKEGILELEANFPLILKKDSLKKELIDNPYTNYLLYKKDGKIVGFLNYYAIYERMEIANFNVLERYQNQKIGSKLLEAFLDEAQSKKIENITLEVKKDNYKAIHLYEKYGFKEVAIREKYYNNVDALLMEKELM